MLKISILERFSAGLCQAVCLQAQEQKGNATPPSESDGVQFLEWLQAANLFVIPLDDQHVWFRYHHIFREFLQQELVSRFSPEDIASLHAAAGSWYAQNGWIEEALNHLLNAGELSAAVHLVAQQRYSAMNNTQWPRLERLLDFFPNEIIETSAELWMLKTWLVYHRGQFNELPAMLQHLAVIVEHETNQQIAKDLIGEISSLRSLVAYHAGDFERAIPKARVALELLDPELWIVRIMARMYLGGSLLAIGDASGGYHAFYDAFEEEQVENKRFKATLLMTVCYSIGSPLICKAWHKQQNSVLRCAKQPIFSKCSVMETTNLVACCINAITCARLKTFSPVLSSDPIRIMASIIQIVPVGWD